MDQVTFSNVAPVIAVRDLDRALRRYGKLGFSARAYEGPDRYGFVERDGVCYGRYPAEIPMAARCPIILETVHASHAPPTAGSVTRYSRQENAIANFGKRARAKNRR